MRHYFRLRGWSLLTLALAYFGASASTPGFEAERALSLDSCRAMALAHNKAMLISAERVRQAGYDKQQAFAAYLPSIDFSGTYFYNQKNISIFDSDQHLPVQNFDPKTGKYEFALVTDPQTGMPVKGPNGQYIPSQVAYLPKESMTFNIHNVFAGALTLTQPVYMGGKIVAMNKLTGFAEDLARKMKDSQAEDIIYAVDGAYWQVVSLEAKKEVATTYVALLDSLSRNVATMVKVGVATRSDQLSVDVKLNEAQIDLTRVDNGLVLSRMALAQLCGLPLDLPVTLTDTIVTDSPTDDTQLAATTYDMEQVYSRRPDIEALELGVKITGQQKKVAMSSMLPNVALVGAYSFSNPNMYDGYKRDFSGAFSVGVMVTVPIWHWGGNYNKYRSARSAETIMKLQLADAKEMVTLQVTQAAFKSREAVKTMLMTIRNQESADENLRQARLSFREGMATTDNVLEAQTAWLKAASEKIDAAIEVRLCDVYLSKVLGTMTY